jgi:FkbM family methyltransferase
MNRIGIKARSVARRLGLLSFIQRARRKRPYEAEFGSALVGAVRPGDTVWDVGANVGFYTRQFLERVGPTGAVVAFEPEPACCAILRRDCSAATLVNAALGERASDGFIQFRGKARSGTRLVAEPGAATVPIKIIAGEDYDGPRPNVLKIDVEGFEEEVLAGMSGILADRRLRAIFLEVHFAMLEQRGKAEAPIRIEQRLRAFGFRLKWFKDRSHLQALRLSAD